MDKLIENKAVSATKNVSNWEFQPSGNIIINKHNTDSQVGGLLYSDTNYVFHGAFKVKNWVFVLEKMTYDKDMWCISAFNGNSYYTFKKFKRVNETTLNLVLIEYVINNFWNILCPEVHVEYMNNTWKITPL